MRGKVRTGKLRHEQPRITPAYAGKSVEHADVIVKVWDHPRLCGEKKWFMTKKTFMAGSPPPMRGKVDQKQLSVDTNGITPAYAGKRCVGKDYGSPFRDHPRLCGEKRGCEMC